MVLLRVTSQLYIYASLILVNNSLSLGTFEAPDQSFFRNEVRNPPPPRRGAVRRPSKRRLKDSQDEVSVSSVLSPPFKEMLCRLCQCLMFFFCHNGKKKPTGQHACPKGITKKGVCIRSLLVRSAESPDYFVIEDVEDAHWGEGGRRLVRFRTGNALDQ